MTKQEAKEILLDMANDLQIFPESKQGQAFKMALKLLDNKSVLDKIRSEIEQEYNRLRVTRADETLELGECLGLKMSLKIIGKYKEESEVETCQI